MKYGFFDDAAKEYVITRPDTPQSWSNYLGSTEYGAIITNNAGGYSFYRSGARGRFLRLRFNNVPMDEPGRYFYIRDRENKDFWSVSWQPVGKPLKEFSSTCRHGTGYTVIESQYSGIQATATYFVPLGQRFEYWHLLLRNNSIKKRRLSIFTFCEFTNQWDTFQDQVNLQYSLFIIRGRLTGKNVLRISIQDNLTPKGKKAFVHDVAQQCWVAMVGAPVASYDTSREAFIGPYRGYHNPLAVERGSCSRSNVYGDNACGSLQTDLILEPGRTRQLLILLGVGDANATGKKVLSAYGSIEKAKEELLRLKSCWSSKLENLTVETPDAEFNHTINVWGLYNALVAYAWSRSASLVYNGERDGLGYRDSVQDILGIVYSCPEDARKRLELLLTGQVSNGGAMPIIKPFEHHPGHERPPAEEEYRSDDCLWLFNAIPAYVAETGDTSFYLRDLPFADKGYASVLGHLRRALNFNLQRMGKHRLPCGLAADWNDCLRLGYHGESLFVAFQLRYALSVYAEIARHLGYRKESLWALGRRENLDRSIQACAWDDDRFVWAFGDGGTVYGTRDSKEGRIYLNTQVWAVISGAATERQAQHCMETVHRELATPYGLMLCAPPFVKTPIDVMRAVVFNPGIKENAGIFNHTQGWGVMAECMLGHGDRAYEYCRASMPAAYNQKAEIRQSEPYVQGQTTYSMYSPRAGNTRTTWLTGAAAWSYHSATQYILGIRPEEGGLRIDPCIPSSWKGFKATRRFRGSIYQIEVRNPDAACNGIKQLKVDGEVLNGNLIPANLPGSIHQVEAVLERG